MYSLISHSINAAVKRLGCGILILSIYQIGSMIVPERTLLSDEFMVIIFLIFINEVDNFL